jgi:hypothetical protein
MELLRATHQMGVNSLSKRSSHRKRVWRNSISNLSEFERVNWRGFPFHRCRERIVFVFPAVISERYWNPHQFLRFTTFIAWDWLTPHPEFVGQTQRVWMHKIARSRLKSPLSRTVRLTEVWMRIPANLTSISITVSHNFLHRSHVCDIMTHLKSMFRIVFANTMHAKWDEDHDERWQLKFMGGANLWSVIE